MNEVTPEMFTKEWLIAFRDPMEIMENHPDFLKMELTMLLIGAVTLVHALTSGGRYPFLWVAILLHGLVAEFITILLPDIDLLWHAQATVTLFGRRLPLYILMLYQAVLYPAVVGASNLGVEWWAQPFAVGLSSLLLDVPLEMMGMKFLFWTWHDTDPNLADRVGGVPWSVFFFILSYGFSVAFAFLGLHKLLSRHKDTFEYTGFWREAVCCLGAAVAGWVIGMPQTVLFHQVLRHDYLIHNGAATLAVCAGYGFVFWCAVRSRKGRTSRAPTGLYLGFVAVCLHYGLMVYLATLAKPESVRATGIHQPVGPCDEVGVVYTATGRALLRHKFLCASDYGDTTFDFRCSKDLPEAGSEMYTICGTPFANRAETAFVVCAFAVFGLLWFWSLLWCPGKMATSDTPRTKKAKQN